MSFYLKIYYEEISQVDHSDILRTKRLDAKGRFAAETKLDNLKTSGLKFSEVEGEGKDKVVRTVWIPPHRIVQAEMIEDTLPIVIDENTPKFLEIEF